MLLVFKIIYVFIVLLQSDLHGLNKMASTKILGFIHWLRYKIPNEVNSIQGLRENTRIKSYSNSLILAQHQFSVNIFASN